MCPFLDTNMCPFLDTCHDHSEFSALEALDRSHVPNLFIYMIWFQVTSSVTSQDLHIFWTVDFNKI